MLRTRDPLSNDQLYRAAPSIFANAAHESRSERYTYIPTIHVVDKLREQGFLPFAVSQSNARTADKRGHTKHMIRLRQASGWDVEVGGEVNEIIMINSHDGTSSYRMMPGVFRVVCKNGLVSGKCDSEIRIHHKGSVIDNVIDGAFRVVEDFAMVANQKEAMKDINLAPAERLLFAQQALTLKYDAAHGTAPVTDQQVLTVRRTADAASDLWSTFNVVQENLIKGGIRVRNANGGRTATRAVTGIDQDVKLNRALWALAEGMRALKA